MTMKATEEAMRLNLRRRRAMALAAAIMDELGDVIADGMRGEAADRLCGIFERNGHHVISDQDRAEMGLEPRDDMGWTPSERMAERRAQRDAMLLMMDPVFMGHIVKR